MGDTFGNRAWTRPGPDRQVGRSRRQLQDRASYDHQDPPGCGALFLLLILAAAAALGVVLT